MRCEKRRDHKQSGIKYVNSGRNRGLFQSKKGRKSLKILLIRFSSIGDIVLTSPVLRCLRKKYPESEIHYLTKTQFHPLLIANPHIDKFYLLEKKNLDELIDQMQTEKYDVIIDLHKNIRTQKVKSSLFPKQVFSFDKINFAKWLIVNFKID